MIGIFYTSKTPASCVRGSIVNAESTWKFIKMQVPGFRRSTYLDMYVGIGSKTNAAGQ